jgi:hypothetical protein
MFAVRLRQCLASHLLQVNVSLSLDAARKVATITLSGPADVWFGVGWNANAMGDKPYAIIVEGKSGNVTERRLGDHDPGHLLQPTQVRVCVSLPRLVIAHRFACLQPACTDH